MLREQPGHPADDAVKRSSRRARVLVVEDDLGLRRLVAGRLERDGHDVYEATDGSEAIAIVRLIRQLAWPTDDLELVILDHNLPGLSGLEVLRRLRARDQAIPTVLITGDPDPALVREAALHGVTVLAKPFSLDQLSQVSRSSLRARREAAS
jgi:CheY-like chemotaxis protein